MTYRFARRDDVDAIADLMMYAGENVLRFVLAELAPNLHPRALLAHIAAQDDERQSYRRCLVVELGAIVVGVANAFPAELFRCAIADQNLSPREIHLQSVTALQDWDSFILNSLAVDPRYRGRGIGSGLIEEVSRQARDEGFDRLTLHVWADNRPARRLYRRAGFTVVARAEVADHPELSHRGGSLLMRRRLDGPNPISIDDHHKDSPQRTGRTKPVAVIHDEVSDNSDRRNE